MRREKAQPRRAGLSVRAGLSPARGAPRPKHLYPTLRPPRRAFPSAPSALSAVNDFGSRRGITLVEVLISIGIVAVGILSIASLLPVGSFQAQKADMEQRKSDLGLNAFRDFKTRAMGNPNSWLRFNGTNYNAYLPLDPTVPAQAAFLPPVAIDPQMVAVAQINGTPAALTNISTFPANHPGGTVPRMVRLTLTAAYHTTPATSKALADAIFMARDDVVVTQPSDASLPAESQFQPVGGTPVQRSFAGEYSWLATLVPNDPAAATAVPGAGQTYTLSVVVFNRRNMAVPAPATPDDGQEEMVSATVNGGGYGGGDVTLFDSTGNAANKLAIVRPGQWLMLCRNEPIPSGTPPTWRNFNWYRVITAAPVELDTGTTYKREVTLAGPDWQVIASPPGPQTYACLFDGAVAVYQRTIRLEDISNEWTP